MALSDVRLCIGLDLAFPKIIKSLIPGCIEQEKLEELTQAFIILAKPKLEEVTTTQTKTVTAVKDSMWVEVNYFKACKDASTNLFSYGPVGPCMYRFEVVL